METHTGIFVHHSFRTCKAVIVRDFGDTWVQYSVKQTNSLKRKLSGNNYFKLVAK